MRFKELWLHPLTSLPVLFHYLVVLSLYNRVGGAPAEEGVPILRDHMKVAHTWIRPLPTSAHP